MRVIQELAQVTGVRDIRDLQPAQLLCRSKACEALDILMRPIDQLPHDP
jgi:hypothetical protein